MRPDVSEPDHRQKQHHQKPEDGISKLELLIFVIHVKLIQKEQSGVERGTHAGWHQALELHAPTTQRRIMSYTEIGNRPIFAGASHA